MTDVEKVDWVVVASLVHELMLDVRVFPCLWDLSIVSKGPGLKLSDRQTYRAVNERVTPVRPHRLHKARRALAVVVEDRSKRLLAFDFDLAVSPSRDLYDGVDDGSVVLVWVEWNLRTS